MSDADDAVEGSDDGSQRSDSEKVTKAEVESLYSTSQEMERSENGNSQENLGSGMNQVPGGAALAALLDLAPFSTYITQRALAGSSGDTPQDQVEKYCKNHKWADRWATFLDFIVRLVVVVLVLGTVGTFVLKALLPLPSFN